jgi:ferredoxin-type protein NapG
MGKEENSKSLSHTLNRRAFLNLTGKALLIVGMGGGLRLLANESNITRPPPAVKDDDDFLALCTRCQKCMEVCPFHVITPVSLSESLISTGTPKLDLTQGTCTYGNYMGCIGYCGPVCPTGALHL